MSKAAADDHPSGGIEERVNGTILLVAHSEWRQGRVAPLLQSKGYEVEWRCPCMGDRLPDDRSAYEGVIVFGGRQSANDAHIAPFLQHEIDWIRGHVDAGGRYLGICLGGQLLARALEARVAPHRDGIVEIGYYPVARTDAGHNLFPESLHVYHWHQEGFDLPDGAELLARGGNAFPNQAFRWGASAYGLQFHPEVTSAVARAWLEDSDHQLIRPGALSRDHQEAQMAEHDGPLHSWMDGFLDHWLALPNLG
jgi:GMP synthase (glutamine-hydrolysing)